jgi:hypothetical protein
MKKMLLFAFIISLSLFGLSAQSTETSDSLKFIESSVKAENATIDFSFNDLTGVLRLTYTLEVFTFDLDEADRLIREAVATFVEENGYFKYRTYPEEDDIRYFAKTRTTRYKKFYILYDKARLEGSF